MKRQLEGLIQHALHAAVAAGDLRLPDSPACVLEDPESERHGDATCRVAMVVARRTGRPAAEIASILARHVRDPDGWLEDVSAGGPGFLNLRASAAFWRRSLAHALEPAASAPPRRGRAVVLGPDAARDPATMRAVAVAEAIRRLLAAAGWDARQVTTEDVDASTFAGSLGGDVARAVYVAARPTRATVARAKGLAAAAGSDPGALAVVPVGPVAVRASGRPLGGAAAAALLGTDAGRLLVLDAPASEAADVDASVARADTIANPLVAVRYALARIARVTGGGRPGPDTDLTPLGASERGCLVALARTDDVIEDAARRAEPHRVVAQVRGVAAAFHRYYNHGRLLDGDPRTVRARRALAAGMASAMRRGLALVGIETSEGR